MIERARRNILTGAITLIPIIVTVWIVSLALNLLISFGRPAVVGAAAWVRGYSPETADLLLSEWFLPVLALIIILVGLYLLGALASAVVGRKLISLFDRLMERIPGVRPIYSASRRLIEVLQKPFPGGQRAVLVKFPTPEMRAIGFVTHTFNAVADDRQVAAVYVPTTPNPTSGFIEIVPVDELIFLDWTTDQAIQFIVTGGVVAPAEVPFERGTRPFTPDLLDEPTPKPEPVEESGEEKEKG